VAVGVALLLVVVGRDDGDGDEPKENRTVHFFR